MSTALAVARYKAAGAQRVYEPNKVPTQPGDAAYAVVSVDTGLPILSRRGGGASLNHRIVVQMFGRSDAAVKDLARLADLAFRDQTLTEFPGQPGCSREVAGQVFRDPDDGSWLSILHTYRYNDPE